MRPDMEIGNGRLVDSVPTSTGTLAWIFSWMHASLHGHAMMLCVERARGRAASRLCTGHRRRGNYTDLLPSDLVQTAHTHQATMRVPWRHRRLCCCHMIGASQTTRRFSSDTCCINFQYADLVPAACVHRPCCAGASGELRGLLLFGPLCHLSQRRARHDGVFLKGSRQR